MCILYIHIYVYTLHTYIYFTQIHVYTYINANILMKLLGYWHCKYMSMWVVRRICERGRECVHATCTPKEIYTKIISKEEKYTPTKNSGMLMTSRLRYMSWRSSFSKIRSRDNISGLGINSGIFSLCRCKELRHKSPPLFIKLYNQTVIWNRNSRPCIWSKKTQAIVSHLYSINFIF